MPIDKIIEKTIEYLSIPSVVGHEAQFVEHLIKDFDSLGYKTEKHPGLLAVHGTEPHSIIVSAHIDRHGLISIGGGEYAYAAQYIKEIKYGLENRSSMQALESISKRFEGETVFAYHHDTYEVLGEGIINTNIEFMENGDSIFHIHEMPEIEQGIPIAYKRAAYNDGQYFKGQIDNAISIGSIYMLCENHFKGTILLSTEEEIGMSWRHIAAFLDDNKIKCDELIIIDTSPYNDFDIIDKGKVVLRTRDKSAEFNLSLVKKIEERCKTLQIPYEVKDQALLSEGKSVDQLGSTELGKLVSSTSVKWSGASIQIPTVMYHTSYETTSRACIKNYYDLLKSILIDDVFINTD